MAADLKGFGSSREFPDKNFSFAAEGQTVAVLMDSLKIFGPLKIHSLQHETTARAPVVSIPSPMSAGVRSSPRILSASRKAASGFVSICVALSMPSNRARPSSKRVFTAGSN